MLLHQHFFLLAGLSQARKHNVYCRTGSLLRKIVPGPFLHSQIILCTQHWDSKPHLLTMSSSTVVCSTALIMCISNQVGKIFKKWICFSYHYHVRIAHKQECEWSDRAIIKRCGRFHCSTSSSSVSSASPRICWVMQSPASRSAAALPAAVPPNTFGTVLC